MPDINNRIIAVVSTKFFCQNYFVDILFLRLGHTIIGKNIFFKASNDNYDILQTKFNDC